MQVEAAQQFPNSLNGIELRGVGREEIHGKVSLMLLAPLSVEQGMVVFDVVADDHDPTPLLSACRLKLFEEVPECLGVEALVFALGEQTAIAQTHGTKVTNAFARGFVAHHRIFVFGRDPHPAPTAVLLEMHLVECPQLNAWIEGQCVEFFYAPLAVLDQTWQPQDVAADSEN